jgi:hypothetical protein
MNRITLYQRLKPEIKKKLEAQHKDYAPAIDGIFNNLKTKDLYCDLTLSELRTIYTFADIFSGNVTQSEILYGDNIFNTK